MRRHRSRGPARPSRAARLRAAYPSVSPGDVPGGAWMSFRRVAAVAQAPAAWTSPPSGWRLGQGIWAWSGAALVGDVVEGVQGVGEGALHVGEFGLVCVLGIETF